MGFFSSLFGGGGGGSSSAPTQSVSLMPAWQEALGEDMSSWVRRYLNLYEPGKPYEGDLSVKTPTSYESLGLSELDKLLSGPATGELFAAAKGQLLDTFSGKYADPNTSPFILAMTKLANQNLGDAITAARGRAGARGTYFTRSSIQEESNLNERTQNYLNSVTGEFIDKERSRQLAAVPIAQGLEQYGNLEAPLKRISASQTYGALPRLLEQADLERQYNEFTRQREELSRIPAVGASVLGKSIPTELYDQPQQTSPLQQLFSVFSKIMGGGSGGSSSGGGLFGYTDFDEGFGKNSKDVFSDPQTYMQIAQILSAICWVAAEVFDGWDDPRTHNTRFFILKVGPKWFRNFYMKHGEKFAAYIKNKPVLKAIIRPIFEAFSFIGAVAQLRGGLCQM